jgi:lipopolysaccharide transport system ATP-binding protein
MADDIVIRAEGLGKKYTIGHQSERERYTALRDVMARGARNLWRKTADLARGRGVVAGDRVEEFWALKDVSFEVRRGEVLGIIGRNGAGKSTLLKILSRITEPSEGRVTIKGRVASLLEVGTGFHPELTGRENIYLNGAILGMTRAEIRRKFDEIVDFAGVEKFLDTPVKRYSSGMYVRLAFAVAAHLEPEILVIDEVLAVGDAEFQKKCLGKMGEVAGGGRTVLFVSHDMPRLMLVCQRGALLNQGALCATGRIDEVVQHYLSSQTVAASAVNLAARTDRSGSGEARFLSISLFNNNRACAVFKMGDQIEQKLGLKITKSLSGLTISSTILTEFGTPVHEFCYDFLYQFGVNVEETYTLTVTLENILLYPGRYNIDLWIGDKNMHRVDYVTGAISFDVIQDPRIGGGRRLQLTDALVYKCADWKIEKCFGR